MTHTASSPLERLHALVREDLDQTNRIILEKLNAQVQLIPTLGSHLIKSGGKRLRPTLTLVSARMFGYSGDRHALLAAVIEFIHTATLLHDDVVDHSKTRRGVETANSVWGDKAPVLVGDFLFSRSFQILVEHADLDALRSVADACAIISEGEVLQLVVSNDLATDEAKYIEVVTHKTASLFSCAAELGAILCRRPPADRQAVADYGLMLGIAYQLVDDALDYSARQETFGKSVGDDFHEGKMTLPVIHAYAHGNEAERQFWCQTLEQGAQPPGSLEQAIDLVRKRGSLEYAMNRAREYAARAKSALAPLPDSPHKQALEQLADFSVDREY
ncbi:MAG: polyprenyl synthetase family protein [Magnetococcus sp. WYHC-3]